MGKGRQDKQSQCKKYINSQQMFRDTESCKYLVCIPQAVRNNQRLLNKIVLIQLYQKKEHYVAVNSIDGRKRWRRQICQEIAGVAHISQVVCRISQRTAHEQGRRRDALGQWDLSAQPMQGGGTERRTVQNYPKVSNPDGWRCLTNG